MTFKPGSIVVLRFPFTDQNSAKNRPALVISPEDYHTHDIVLLAITSVAQDSRLCLTRWQSAGLLKPSWIKPVVGTFESALVRKQLGTIAKQDVPSVINALRLAVNETFLAA